MMLHRMVFPVLACAAAGLPTAAARAELPWHKIVPFKKIEADPNNPYFLTEEQGPWMILAVTFSGPEAEQQSRELVQELRSVYKLPAWRHRMSFDFGKVTGRGVNQFGGAKQMSYRRKGTEEIAVLVGSYATVDDPDAQKTLEMLRYTTPECMSIEKLNKEGRTVSRPLAGLRWVTQTLISQETKQRPKGPMGYAFITSNPLLPKDYYVPKGLDKFLIELNKGVKHSLLNCPGKYTVRVATFNGQVVIDQRKVQEVENGKKLPGKLEEAAQKAHKLTEALRAKGVEAYEFHDRTSSMVTIGSFDSVGTPRPDGKTEINPAIHAIMETYGADKTVVPGRPPAVGQAKSLAGIHFDIQPLPVEIPKYAISAEYRRDVLSLR